MCQIRNYLHQRTLDPAKRGYTLRDGVRHPAPIMIDQQQPRRAEGEFEVIERSCDYLWRLFAIQLPQLARGDNFHIVRQTSAHLAERNCLVARHLLNQTRERIQTAQRLAPCPPPCHQAC